MIHHEEIKKYLEAAKGMTPDQIIKYEKTDFGFSR